MLRKLARSALRGAGRASGRFVSRHVLPDNLIPSVSTQRGLKKAAKLAASPWKKKAKPKPKPAGRKPASAPKKPAKPTRADLSSWQNGKGLPSSSWLGESGPARPSSRPSRLSSALGRVKSSRRYAQGRDLVLNPRLVAQMKIEELQHDLQRTKATYSSKISSLKRRFGL